MEGSSLGRLDDDGRFPTEQALERTFIDRFKPTPGMVLVACSAQNIDRVVTIYRAAKQTGRTLIVDSYAAEVLKATGNEHIPRSVRGWLKRRSPGARGGEPNLSSATSHRPWRTRRPSTSPAHCRSGGQS